LEAYKIENVLMMTSISSLNTTMGQIINEYLDESHLVALPTDTEDPVSNIYAAESDAPSITNNTYYIGIPYLLDGHYLFMTHIRPNTYFQYDHDDVCDYLREYSSIQVPETQSAEIMKTEFAFEDIGGERVHIARVVLKTCWLRIFQRKWRRSRNPIVQ
jgi:hypothetical protein